MGNQASEDRLKVPRIRKFYVTQDMADVGSEFSAADTPLWERIEHLAEHLLTGHRRIDSLASGLVQEYSVGEKTARELACEDVMTALLDGLHVLRESIERLGVRTASLRRVESEVDGYDWPFSEATATAMSMGRRGERAAELRTLADEVKTMITNATAGTTSPSAVKAAQELESTCSKHRKLQGVLQLFQDSSDNSVSYREMEETYGGRTRASKIASYLRRHFPEYEFRSAREASRTPIGEEIPSVDRRYWRKRIQNDS